MKVMKLAQVAVMMMVTLAAADGWTSSPGGGRGTGEQYAIETIYARTCKLNPPDINRFEQGIPLLLMHMEANEQYVLEALDQFYKIKNDKKELENIANYKPTPEGCSRVKGRMESALEQMDKYLILVDKKNKDQGE